MAKNKIYQTFWLYSRSNSSQSKISGIEAKAAIMRGAYEATSEEYEPVDQLC